MNRLLKLSVKTYMAGLLVALAIIGIAQYGNIQLYVPLFLAVPVAVILDLIFHYLKTKRIVFPSSAFISGMIIALVLSPQTEWFIPVVTSCIAIGQKYIICYRGRHIFNPANFGLLCAAFVFSVYPSWWGMSFWPLIIVAGVFISYKMKRLLLPVIFIVTFVLLFGLDILMVNLFFVFVMLIEPMTTPLTKKGRAIYAVSVAVFSFTFFKLIPQFDFSLLGLALGNTLVPFLNKLK